MKFILLVAVVVLVLWIARVGRRRVDGRGARSDAPAAPAQESMVACSRCGVHLPRSEALPGRGGLFCSEGHRAEHERSDAAGH
jgi:uncharacterized protein